MLAVMHTNAQTDSERMRDIIAGRYRDQPTLGLVQAPQVFAPVVMDPIPCDSDNCGKAAQ